MKVFAAVLSALALCLPVHADPDTEAREMALRALCPIGLKAGRSVWGDDNINAAIASIYEGLNPANGPDHAEEIAYKTCNYGGYLE